MLNPDIVDQQHALLHHHRQDVAHLLRQAATYGGELYAPVTIASSIAEDRAAIARVKAWLREHGEHVEDVPDDEAVHDEVTSPVAFPDRQYIQNISDNTKIGVAVAGNVYGPVTVNTSLASPLAPRMATPPTHFVPRPAEYEQLIQMLTAPSRSSHVAICAAIRGAGGYGKTTLAQAICQDDRIRAAYPGGTLWVTVGEQPQSIPDLIANLVAILTGVRPALRTEDEAAVALDTALGDRACLIIVDDVWSATHLHPFIHGAPNCTRLITTRIAETLPTQTAVLSLKAMHANEAVDVLRTGLPLTETLVARITDLAGRLGGWPLLLSLVNGSLREQVERGNTVHAALIQVEQALAERGLTAFDPASSEQRRRAVASAITISLDHLPEPLRFRHAELAIFPGDIPIPFDIIASLWQSTGKLTLGEAEEVCLRLANRSLVQNYDFQARTLTLHDEVRSYLCKFHQDALPSWHAALLTSTHPRLLSVGTSYDQSGGASSWADLPLDASYLWEHLGYHLVQAGQSDVLVATVLDLRYIVQKMTTRDIFAAEADIQRALQAVPNHPAVISLERIVRLHSHILATCKDSTDRAATLFAYACHEASLHSYLPSTAPFIRYPAFQPRSTWVKNEHPALLRTLGSHQSLDWSVALSTDGARVLSSSGDDMLRLNVALSTDGTRALSSSDDGTLRLWDLERGLQLRVLEGHQCRVYSLALSADGRRALLGSDDGTLQLWDLERGLQLRVLEGHQGAVLFVTLSSDETRALSSSDDGTLRLWDLERGLQQPVLVGHLDGMNSVALSADGMRALSGSDDGTLRLWDLERGLQLRVLEGHQSVVWSVALSADGTRAVSNSSDGTLRLWNLTSNQVPQVPADQQGWINALALSADGARALSSGYDGTLRLWDLERGLQLHVLEGHPGTVNSVAALSADGTRALSGASDGTLRLWDLERGLQLRALYGHRSRITSVVLNTDETHALSGSEDGTLRLWDLERGLQLRVLESRGVDKMALQVALSADGTRLLSGSADGTLRLWDLAAIQRHFIRGYISSVAPSWLRQLIFRPLRVLEGHQGFVNSLALSADGTRALSSGYDGTLRVWDLESGLQLRVLEGHQDVVWSVALSADGTRALSGSADGTLRLWDSATGRCQAIFRTETPIASCTLFPNGQAALVGDARGYVFVLNILWSPPDNLPNSSTL